MLKKNVKKKRWFVLQTKKNKKKFEKKKIDLKKKMFKKLSFSISDVTNDVTSDVIWEKIFVFGLGDLFCKKKIKNFFFSKK